jgi:aldehyde dehydrogenase (NAD+)
MTFRTPDEAVQLANHSRYGLAASVWSETIGLALNVAAKLDSGVVWVNATNMFDASAGFGGKKESGFGREGGGKGPLSTSSQSSGRSAKLRAPKLPTRSQATRWLV